MIDFEREIVDLYETKSSTDCLRGKLIKEHMRKGIVNKIAELLALIIKGFEEFKKNNSIQIVVKALNVMTGIIDWASLDLFMGNLPLLVQFLGMANLKTPSAKCIYSIIDKGMDPKTKLDMFEYLNLINILAQWDPNTTVSEEEFGKAVILPI